MSESSEPMFDSDTERRLDQLLALGYLDKDVEFCGHTYGLRTLNGDEELLASITAKPYLESFGQMKAWAWANVGLALTHVDGDPNFCPPTEFNRQGFADARFKFVTKWFWPLGEYLFEEFKELEAERDSTIEALKGKSERSPQNSIAWRDSSTDQGDSANPEILDLVD